MNRFAFRSNITLYATFLLTVSLVLIISPVIPNSIGIVSFQSISGDGLSYHYSDYDTGIRTTSMLPVSNASSFIAFPETNRTSFEQTVTINTPTTFPEMDTDVIGVYPAEPVFDFTLWSVINETILVVYTENAATGLGLIDVATGDFTPYLTIDDFRAGLVSLSPNRRYLLLRETETNFTASSPPQPNQLVDLQTATITDLGELIYAYWSPDSTQIVLGHPAEERLQSTVEIYDIANDTIQILDVTIARGDTSFFVDSINALVNAILWSPDSQNLIIHNRALRQVQHIDTSGTILSSYEGGRLLPKQWSPDGRYVLTVGYFEDVAGAFIIDTHQQTRTWLQSNVVIQDSLADFAWSNSSQHIAVMTRTSGTNQVFQLAVYDLDGQMIGMPEIIKPTAENTFFLNNSLQWSY